MPKTPRKELKATRKAAWLICLPGFLANLIFGWYPLAVGIIIAFQVWPIIGKAEFVGLTHFYKLANDPLFYKAFLNTFYYAGLSIALTFFLPIIISILLLEMKKGTIRVMMILWFLPMAAMSGIIIWKWFYNPYYGLFNGILTIMGLPTSRWLSSSRLAMFCIVLPGLIMFAPGLIYIASLQSIPSNLYESAELEGAGMWQKIWHITLPGIRPIIAMLLLLAVIGNMQVFDQAYVMTGGGPGYATTTVVIYYYNIAFQSLRFGKGSALALILGSVIMALIIIQRKYFKENINV